MSSRGRVAAVGAILVGSFVMVSLWWGLQHAALSNPPVLGRVAPQLAICLLYTSDAADE